MPHRRLDLLKLLSRFGLAGLINTAIGFCVIAGLDVGLHITPPIANAFGYLASAPIGFLLTRTFVFQHRGSAKRSGPRYIGVIVLAFCINQLVLQFALRLFGSQPKGHLASQFLGLGAYTIFSFIACRYWAFREQYVVPLAAPRATESPAITSTVDRA